MTEMDKTNAMDMDSVFERAKRVRLFILDVDGVMTDGRIVYGASGDEQRFFDVHDGLGIVLLRKAGIPCVIITAKRSRIVKMRAKDLEIDKVYEGNPSKLESFFTALAEFGVEEKECLFIGDDLNDMPILKRVGFAVAVPNAVSEVKRLAHYVTERFGGRGAVREVCEIILKAQRKWDAVLSSYLE